MGAAARDPLQPADLGIILSYKCANECRHCLYNCGPYWRGWMKEADLQAAMQNVQRWAPGIQIHLSGGEPFLNFPLLLRAVEIAHEYRLSVYAETSACWCNQADLVYERFEALCKAGLDAILISCSPFHAEKIALRKTLLAINAGLDIFGLQGVLVYLPDWIEQIRRFGLDEPVPLRTYQRAYGHDTAGVLFWEGYGLISGGRAGYFLGDYTERLPASAFEGDHCRLEILHPHQAHFDLFGNFILGYCGGLSMGNWHNLAALVEQANSGNYPEIVKVLIEQGPYGLSCLAEAEYGYTPLHSGYAGKCHLCVDVRRHLSRSGEFPELQPAEFYAHLPG